MGLSFFILSEDTKEKECTALRVYRKCTKNSGVKKKSYTASVYKEKNEKEILHRAIQKREKNTRREIEFGYFRD